MAAYLLIAAAVIQLALNGVLVHAVHRLRARVRACEAQVYAPLLLAPDETRAAARDASESNEDEAVADAVVRAVEAFNAASYDASARGIRVDAQIIYTSQAAENVATLAAEVLRSVRALSGGEKISC